MPPFFFPYSQREIEEFYMQFADQVGDAVPIVIHNLPQSTSKLELETVRRLINSGLFAGIQDSSGDWSYLEQLLSLKQERPLAVLNGTDRLAAQALQAGADGLISSAACAVPELLVSLARALPERRESLNARLLEFIAWTEKFPEPVAVKRAVALRGQKSGPELTPLAPETRQELEQFARWFSEWLPVAKKVAANG
jgi:4-hydroxy-tetrahydrodipicolinate synthase